MCFTLKQRKKELEHDIAVLEKKLAKINAKLDKKEQRKNARMAEKEASEQNKDFEVKSFVHERVVETKVEEPETAQTKAEETVVEPTEQPVVEPTQPVEAKKPEQKEETKPVAKRGRPKKAASVVVDSKTADEKPAAAKRGRPKKVEVEPVVKEGKTAQTTENETKKSVGRPKKQPALSQTEQSEKVKVVRYHVNYDEEKGKWLIKKSGAARIIASYDRKEDALERAKNLAKSNDGVLSVQRKDGRFGKH